MAEFQKICVICGCKFIAGKPYTVYCSQRCKQTAYRTWRTVKRYSKNEKITDDQLSQAIDDGLSRQEIADKYGMHVASIDRRMQRLGKYAGGNEGGDYLRGIRQNWGNKLENLKNNTPTGYADCWHYIKSHDDMIKQKHSDFWYLETKRKRIRLKCKKCFGVIERAGSTVRTKTVCCEYCAEKQKQQIELQNERVKLMRFFVALKESKTPKICKECGKEYYSQYENSAYCSHECRKKNRKAGSGIRSRCRHYGVYYDPAVKPKLIFERDHYICQICGMATNPDDKSWNGNFGPYSPTVDHILALANGGEHTWENVQCAHAKCNSWKRDLLTV